VFKSYSFELRCHSWSLIIESSSPKSRSHFSPWNGSNEYLPCLPRVITTSSLLPGFFSISVSVGPGHVQVNSRPNKYQSSDSHQTNALKVRTELLEVVLVPAHEEHAQRDAVRDDDQREVVGVLVREAHVQVLPQRLAEPARDDVSLFTASLRAVYTPEAP
jgi:hypothetical protein